MKKTVIALMSSAAFVARCFSGTFPEDPRVIPALIVHAKARGSGCLLALSNSVYLVTARHVLFGDFDGTNAPVLLSPRAEVTSYSCVGTTNVSGRMVKLSLAQLLTAGEIRFSTNRDVALVRIAQHRTNDAKVIGLPGAECSPPDTGLRVFGAESMCQAKEVDVGGEVFMFGYPTSLTVPISKVFDPSEPLLRKGIVAGINLQKRTIIIDCPAYFGNSGGPVVQVEHLSLDVTRFRILGLVTGFVPFLEEWENKTMKYSHVITSNSGSTVVEPIDSVLELVWK